MDLPGTLPAYEREETIMASLLRSITATSVNRPVSSVDEVLHSGPRDSASPRAHYEKFWSWLLA